MWSALQPGSKMRATIEIRNISPMAEVYSVLGSAQVRHEPRADARLAVPLQGVEIVAHRMISVVAGIGLNGIAYWLPADAIEANMLQILLDVSDIAIDERTRIVDCTAD